MEQDKPWASDKMLHVYIYDYCVKKNFKDAAKAFLIESQIKEPQVPIDTTDGFLYEWWTVFWDIFAARTQKNGSQEAQIYVDAQTVKAQRARNTYMQQKMRAQQQNQLMQDPSNPSWAPESESFSPNPFPDNSISMQTVNSNVNSTNINSNNPGFQNSDAHQILSPSLPNNATLNSYVVASMQAVGLANRSIESLSDQEKLILSTELRRRQAANLIGLSPEQINQRQALYQQSIRQQQFNAMQMMQGPPMMSPEIEDLNQKRARSNTNGLDSPLITSPQNQAVNITGIKDSPSLNPGVPNIPRGGWPTGLNPQQQQQLLIQQQRQLNAARQRQLNSQLSNQELLRLQQQNGNNRNKMMHHQNVPILGNPPAKRRPTLNSESQDPTIFINAHEQMPSPQFMYQQQQYQQLLQQQQQQQQQQRAMIAEKSKDSHSPANHSSIATSNTNSVANSPLPYVNDKQKLDHSSDELEKLFSLGNYSDSGDINMDYLDENGNSNGLQHDYMDDLFDNNHNQILSKEEANENGNFTKRIHEEVPAPSPSEASASILRPLCTLTGHSNKVSSCVIDKNGLVLASAGNEKKVLIWDISDISHPNQILSLGNHSSTITCARFLDIMCVSGEMFNINTVPLWIVTCGYDKTVCISQINGIKDKNHISDETIICFNGHQRLVTGVDFCPIAFNLGGEPDYIVASLDAEGELYLWNSRDGEKHLSINLPWAGKTSRVSLNPIRFKPVHSTATSFIMAAAYGKSLHIIHVQFNISPTLCFNEKIISISTMHQKNISDMAWSKDGHWFITASEDIVIVWDATQSSNPASREPFKFIVKLPSHNGKISSCTFLEVPTNPKSNLPPRIIVGEYESMHIWQVNKSEFSFAAAVRISTMSGCHAGVVNCINTCVDPRDSSSLILASASGSIENNLRIWSL